MAVVAEGDIEVRLSPASVKNLESQVTSVFTAAGKPAGAGFGATFDKSADAAIKQAGSSFKNIEKEAGNSGKQAGGAFGKSFSGALTGVAAFSLIRQGAKFLGDSVAEYALASKGIAQTNQVLKTTGGIAGVTAKNVDDLSKSLGRAAAADDDIVRRAENVLLTFTAIRNEVGKGNDIFNQATAIALDMSTALGTDLQGAIIQVGKALNDPIIGVGALAEVGVSFTEQQKEQIKTLTKSGDVMGAQKLVLAELNKEFGGTAKAVADADGGVQRAAVSIGELKESIGGALAPALSQVTPLATGLATSLGEVPPAVSGAGLAFLGLTAGIAVVLRLRTALNTTLTSLSEFGPAGKAAAGGLGALGRIGGVLALTSALEVGIDKLFETIDERRAGGSVSDLAGDLADLANGAVDLDGALRQAGTGNSFLDQQIRGLKAGLKGAIFAGFASDAETMSTRLDRVDKALVELVNNGAAKSAAADLKLIQERFHISDDNLDVVFNDYTKALDDNASAASVNEAAQNDLKGGIDDTGSAADDAAKDVDTLDKAIGYLSDTITNSALGQFTDFESKLVSFREAQLRLGDALKENGNNFDLNTSKGLENRDALLRVIGAAQEYVDGQVETGKVAQTAAAYQDAFKAALGEVADKFPALRGQIDLYIAKLGQAPTTLNLDTSPAAAKIQGITTALQGFYNLANRKPTTSIDFIGPLSPAPRNAIGRDVVKAGRPLLVGDGGQTEVFVPQSDGKLYRNQQAAARAGVGSSGASYQFGDINVYDVNGNPEATAFATMSQIAMALNL